LITFLDKQLGKDDLATSLERYEDFEQITREDSESMSDFIAKFDAKYNRIAILKMTLPSPVLAFMLLKKANISENEKLLVLTGMNYEQKDSLYEQAKTSLMKFKGDNSFKQNPSSAPIKLEPAFLAENEEALLAAGYVKRKPFFGKKFNNFNQNKNKRPVNPNGANGKPLLCKCCGSF
jgi:hypothetical protein